MTFKLKDDFVGQIIVERAFKNREAAEQWLHSMQQLLESKNQIANSSGTLNIEPHLWEPSLWEPPES